MLVDMPANAITAKSSGRPSRSTGFWVRAYSNPPTCHACSSNWLL